MGEQLRLGALGKREIVPGVTAVDVRAAVIGVELLQRVLADGLEHQQAGVGARAVAAHELLVDQPFECIEVGAGHPLGRLDRRASSEDGEAPERLCLGLAEEPVAPIDRGAQRALPVGRVERTGAEDIQRLAQARIQLLGPEQRGAGGRELDRERQPVEPAADLADGAGIVLAQLEVAVVAARAVGEERAGRCSLDGGRISVRRAPAAAPRRSAAPPGDAAARGWWPAPRARRRR